MQQVREPMTALGKLHLCVLQSMCTSHGALQMVGLQFMDVAMLAPLCPPLCICGCVHSACMAARTAVCTDTLENQNAAAHY